MYILSRLILFFSCKVLVEMDLSEVHLIEGDIKIEKFWILSRHYDLYKSADLAKYVQEL